MRIFVYKILFVILCFYLLFEFTVKLQINKFKNQVESIKSKENLNIIETKIRKEIESGLKKDRILSKEDAKIIKKFIIKLNKELDESE
tara:strand:- start:299 stop:562 length:264 start_codon:yes stop_codon:yes gene_type:complete